VEFSLFSVFFCRLLPAAVLLHPDDVTVPHGQSL